MCVHVVDVFSLYSTCSFTKNVMVVGVLSLIALAALFVATVEPSASSSWGAICSNLSSSSDGGVVACPALAKPFSVDNVTLVFGSGESPGHTFVVDVCQPTYNSPPTKSRLITSGPGLNCSSAFVTQFGPPGSWVHCEAAYNTVREPCRWAALDNVPTAMCAYGELRTSSSGALSFSTLHVTLMCSSNAYTRGNATVVANGAALPHIELLVYSPAVCSCGHSPAPSASHAIVADALLGSVVALIVIALTYSIGHNYFVKGLRGWSMLPWAAHFGRRSNTYDVLSQEDESTAHETSVQHGVE